MIDPDSMRHVLWVVISATHVIYDVVVAPRRIPFNYEEPPAVHHLRTFMLLYWVCDIVVCFSLGYLLDALQKCARE